MQVNLDSVAYIRPLSMDVRFGTPSPLFDNAWQAPLVQNQNTQLVDASLLGSPDLAHLVSHSNIEPKVPSCQEVPGTRLIAGGAPTSRLPSQYRHQDDQSLEDGYYGYTIAEPPMRSQQQSKVDGLSTKSRPTKPERTLCKSLARMVFLFYQAQGVKDIEEAEKMLACSLQGAGADQRSSEYAVTVLHALFEENSL